MAEHKITRATAVEQIDPKYHAAADALAAEGMDWGAIMAIFAQVVPLIIDLIKKK